MFTKLFDFVPGWAYALALAILAVLYGVQLGETAHARNQLAELTNKVEANKIEAKRVLDLETLKTTKTNKELKDAQTANETAAKANAIISNNYKLALKQLGRLRDPAGGGSCSGAQSGSAPGSSNSAGNFGEAPGLLSEGLSGLLRAESEANDKVNDAYAVCRADAISIREKLKGSQ